MVGSAAFAESYARLFARLDALCGEEDDVISLMATIACEFHHGLPQVDWAGFYRVVAPGLLKVGPYQGGHGCLSIPFSHGICGRCARERLIINVADVTAEPDHIACSSTTRSELVVPILTADDELIAVFDLDSDQPAAFTAEDEAAGQRVAAYFGGRSDQGA